MGICRRAASGPVATAMTVLSPLESLVLFAGEPPTPTAITHATRGDDGPPFELRLLVPPFPWLDHYLAGPRKPSGSNEHVAIARAQSALLLHSISEDTTPEARIRALARILIALIELGGLAAILPAAQKVVERQQILRLAPHLETPEGRSALFLHRHLVQEEATVWWYHSHGMEQFGLPDLEFRSAPEEVEQARRLVEGELLYLLAGGREMCPGVIIEAVEGEQDATFEVVTAQAREGHAYGAYGALELRPLSR
jgi:hypothetical protein